MEKIDSDPARQRQELAEEEIISLDVLEADPQLYKGRLLLVVEATPWDRSVADVQGGQAENLLGFCLDTNNLEIIEGSLDRIFKGALEEDNPLKKSLADIDSAEVPLTLGGERIDLRSEKSLRKRLLAWVDYLDTAAGGEPENGATNPPLAAQG